MKESCYLAMHYHSSVPDALDGPAYDGLAHLPGHPLAQVIDVHLYWVTHPGQMSQTL